MKTCYKCKIEKKLDEFNKNKNSPDGYFSYCRICANTYNPNRKKNTYYSKNREAILEKSKSKYIKKLKKIDNRIRICSVCNIEKTFNEFYKNGGCTDGILPKCINCYNESFKKPENCIICNESFNEVKHYAHNKCINCYKKIYKDNISNINEKIEYIPVLKKFIDDINYQCGYANFVDAFRLIQLYDIYSIKDNTNTIFKKDRFGRPIPDIELILSIMWNEIKNINIDKFINKKFKIK